MQHHLMIVPSFNCPAQCSYCFGPHEQGPNMTRDTVRAIAEWQADTNSAPSLSIVFHGGEPLLAGFDFYSWSLPLLREQLAPRKVRFAIQSNLWPLTPEMCELFWHYGVSLGTSLDGPEKITDAQRGSGYFRRTMAGIERASKQGLEVGCVCTFTGQSAVRAPEIFDFFYQEGLNFSIQPCISSIRSQTSPALSLVPTCLGQLLLDMLELYLDKVERVHVLTLDSMCRAVGSGRGSVCTFRDCLGEYLAVDPIGDIYPCQRFAGLPQYRLGHIRTRPTVETLGSSPAWRALKRWQEAVVVECAGCPHFDYCRGGCPYNATAREDDFNPSGRDPYCPAYRRTFQSITDKAMTEVFSEQNLDALADDGGDGGLLRSGRLLSIMRGARPFQQAGPSEPCHSRETGGTTWRR